MTSRRLAFASREFRLFWSARFLFLASHYALAVVIAQYVYERTHRPLDLGFIGLAVFLPRFLLALVAGQVADRFDRRHVVLMCRATHLAALCALFLAHLGGPIPLPVIYTFLAVTGAVIAFDGSASMAIVPQLVPADHFTNAVTWNSSAIQLAMVLGPAFGGWLYGFGGLTSAFVVTIVMRCISVLCIASMRTRTEKLDASPASWATLMAGVHYVVKNRLILGAISLDLFAVLLGGAVALLPVYANDVLDVGAKGLGVLRAAPSIGAVAMSLLLARYPIRRDTGQKMLWCVAIFGLATVGFGLSQHFFLSLFFLAVLGAADMVSMVVRGVLVQMETPHHMRGRVSAVNFVFIGASNDLGEFESGITAHWFGTVPAVVLGGVGTLLVVALWAKKFPEIRRYSS
ncbi:MAG: MFS transporter [Deltaproteobacteria bacterium]|nr:MFS transporter [Deltaproteobacteria bacterium]